jgi:hypothetical protein
LRDKFHRPVPGADLLLSNVYDQLIRLDGMQLTHERRAMVLTILVWASAIAWGPTATQDFPPSQKPGSFSIDGALEAL